MSKNTYTGLGFFSVLQIIFIVLKVTGLIDWSWWWVFAPLWIDLILFAICIIVALVCIKKDWW